MSKTRKLVKKLLFRGSKSSAKNLQHGHIWVRVGVQEPKMFELDAQFLKHPLFEDLLNFSMEEFGCSYNGALRIACDRYRSFLALASASEERQCISALRGPSATEKQALHE